MNTLSPTQNRSDIPLPSSAPLVRVTAGVGSAGQKTWNLRRPVTLIGGRRPAHIVLHDKDVSAAHCVIVNTGTEVLLKDLCTAKGTVCNRDKVDLVILSDGDVITVGATKIQVAIRTEDDCNGDSGVDLEFADPTKLRRPIALRFDHADKEWRIEQAVTLVGRHAHASIRLDVEDIERRHAVLFSFCGEAAIFDLTGRSNVSINGHPCTIGGLYDGDRLGLGPLALVVRCEGGLGQDTVDTHPTSAQEADDAAHADSETSDGDRADVTPGGDAERAVKPVDGDAGATPADGTPVANAKEPNRALGNLQSELTNIESNITDSWQQLNGWQVHGDTDEAEFEARIRSMEARETELNERDAVIRGQLHDVTRYQEQVSAREKDLEKQLAGFQEEIDNLSSAKKELETREQEVARRGDELRRREHVVAQRWSRLQRASCPHCGKPVSVDS